MNDIQNLTIILPIVIICIILAEFLAKRKLLSAEISRKLLHLVIGIIVSFSPFIFSHAYYLIGFGLLSALFNFLSIKIGILKTIDSKFRHSYGTVYFSISFTLLVYLFWDSYKLIIAYSFLIFTIGDFFAGITSKMLNQKQLLNLSDEPKSFQGAIGNIISSFITFLILYFLLNLKLEFLDSTLQVISLALVISTLVAIIEILSTKGSDNFFVPLSLGLIFYICYFSPININQIFMGFALGSIVAVLSIRLKLLSNDGALMALILATIIYGLGEWQWTLPIFLFFVLSSLLSRVSDFYKTKKHIKELAPEKGSKRDMYQVLANGFLPLIFVILYFLIRSEFFYYLFLVAIAVHTSDTWSTEIGTAISKKTILITNFKQTEKGKSGGISLWGSIGGLMGSLIIIMIGNIFVNLELKLILLLTFFGFLGNITDSLLGALFQASYKCQICGKFTEKKKHCENETSLISGFKIIDNDIVNFSSALIACSILYIILL